MARNEGSLEWAEPVTPGHRSCTPTSPKRMDRQHGGRDLCCLTGGCRKLLGCDSRETEPKVSRARWDSAQTNTRVPVLASGAGAALGACETWAWATWQREPEWQWQWWCCCWPWCHQHCGTLHSPRDIQPCTHGTDTHTHTHALRVMPGSMLSGTRSSWSPRQPLEWLKAQEVQVRPCCREQSVSSLAAATTLWEFRSSGRHGA